jgi:hypothetical protein
MNEAHQDRALHTSSLQKEKKNKNGRDEPPTESNKAMGCFGRLFPVALLQFEFKFWVFTGMIPKNVED